MLQGPVFVDLHSCQAHKKPLVLGHRKTTGAQSQHLLRLEWFTGAPQLRQTPNGPGITAATSSDTSSRR